MRVPGDNAALVRAVYQAYGDRQWHTFRALLTDDFAFTSPYDDAIGIDAYRARCWPPGDNNRSFEIARVTEDADGAFITYLVTTKTGASFRNTEYLTIADGKVRAVDVYFGASYRGGVFVAKKPE